MNIRLYKLQQILLIIILFTIPSFLNAQNNQFNRLKSFYLKADYQNCYNEAIEIDKPSAEILLIKALSFHKLENNSGPKKEIKKPLLHSLEIIQEAKEKLNNPQLIDSSFFVNEFKTIQETIYNKAKNWFEFGLSNKAETYFDAIHETFDNTKRIFVNHYGFEDEYFVLHLKSQIDIPEEFYEYYKEKYDLLKKYYYEVEAFDEWNNPIYRMANTAKDVDYLTKDEKMIFYFLNLVRMNPELFRKTFLDTRLHIRYHGDLDLKVPVFDSLEIDKFSNNLTFDEFFELPVHRLYDTELPKNTIERFVETTVIRKSPNSTSYRYDIDYHGFYKFLKNHHPELLNLRNLSRYNKSETGNEYILFKLYDKEFTIYQKTYEKETSDFYHQSLFKRLRTMKSKSIIRPNRELFELAECWAVEAGNRGLKGHDRVGCPYGYDSECCDYGNKNGLDVVLSLLIDRYVPDLGHRHILLGSFSEMGAAIRPHNSSFKYNAVLDFYK